MPTYAICSFTYDSYPIKLLVKYSEGAILKIYDDTDKTWYDVNSDTLFLNLIYNPEYKNLLDYNLALSAMLDILANSLDYSKITGTESFPNPIDLS